MIPNDVPLHDGTIVRVVDDPDPDSSMLGKVMAVVNVGGLMHLIEPWSLWDEYRLMWFRTNTFPMLPVKQLVGTYLWITSSEIVRAWCSIEEKP